MPRKYTMVNRQSRTKEDTIKYQRKYYERNRMKNKEYKELIGDLKYIAENYLEFKY